MSVLVNYFFQCAVCLFLAYSFIMFSLEQRQNHQQKLKVHVFGSPHIEDTGEWIKITSRRKLENRRNLWDTEQHFCNAAVQAYLDSQITPNLQRTSSRDRETMKEMPKCWIKNWMQEMDLLLPDTNNSDDSEPDYGSDFDDIEWLPQNLIVLFNQVIIVFFKFISISYTKSSLWLRASSWPKQPVSGQSSPTYM